MQLELTLECGVDELGTHDADGVVPVGFEDGIAAREAFAHPICFDVNDRQLLGWGAPRPQISRSAQSMKDVSASDRSHSITPGSTATAESHSGRTTAATTTGSGTGADSNANRT